MKKPLLTLLAAILISSTLMSQIPQTMSFQGSLVDPNTGDPLPDDTYVLDFSLWDASTSGNNPWGETHTGVMVVNGLFNVILGSMGAPLSSDQFTQKMWLAIVVNSEPLLPRIQLTASAYSLAAASVYGESNRFPSSGNVGIGTINPAFKLSISDNTSNLTDPLLYLEQTDASGDNVIRFDVPNSNYLIGFDASDGYKFKIGAGADFDASNTFVIDNPGNAIGIGTNNPVKRLHLYDNSGTQLRLEDANGYFDIGGGGDFFIRDETAEMLTILGSSGNVGIGTSSPTSKLEVNGTVTAASFVGDGSGLSGVGGLTGLTDVNNTLLGQNAGTSLTTGGSNTFIGKSAGQINSTASFNTFIGTSAGSGNLTGEANIFVGSQAGTANTAGNQNIFIGSSAGALNDDGSNNVVIGQGAGFNNVSGSGNVFIGSTAGTSETGSNKLYIDNSGISTPLIYGEFDNDLVRINGDFEVTGDAGIGTSSPDPSAALEVSSTSKGVLFPRMTKTQRDAIASPVGGLMIWQSDNTPGLRVYDGTNWKLMTNEIVILKDIKTQSDNGQIGTANTWVDRDLNTKEGDCDFANITLDNLGFNLEPGVYQIEGSSPAWQTGLHKTRVYNVTDGVEVILGTQDDTNTGDGNRSFFGGFITITSQKTIKIQHYQRLY